MKLVACQGPQQARRYAAAGEMLLKASKMFTEEDDTSYEMTLNELGQAANYGLNGGDCKVFKCEENTTQ